MTTPAEGATGTDGPQPLVRLAGLPVPVLTSLRFSTTAARAGWLVSEREWLVAESEKLSDLLYPVIGAAEGNPAKPRLVGLRRSVHRMRPPAPTEWDTPVRSALPAELDGRIDAWVRRLRQWREERDALPSVLERESAEREAALRRAAADPGFRRALWLSSRPLAHELDKWLADPGRRPRRQSMARLAKYVTRAATKTSPYSAFATSGMGAWSAGGPVVRVSPEPDVRGVLELSEFLRGELVGALLAHPGLAESARVRVNPSAVVRDGTVSFLGRPPVEPVLGLPVTAAVRECLDLLRRPHLTLGELRSRLAAAGGTDVPAVTGFVDRLVDTGLLEVAPPVPGDPPAMAAVAGWVAVHGGAELADVAESLRALARDLTDPVPVTDVAGFRSQYQSLVDIIVALAGRLGIAGRLNLGGRTDDPPWPVLHDSVLRPGTSARCGVASWRDARTDLEQVGRWLAVFDSALPLRLALGELWHDWFGPVDQVPFLTLYRTARQAASGDDARAQELRRLLSGEYVLGVVARSEFASVRQLARLREEALAPLREVAPGPDGVVRVDPAALAEVAAGWPDWIGPVRSLGCYVQPLPPDHECTLVLNMTNTGYGQGRTRVRYLLGLAGADVPGDPSGPAGGYRTGPDEPQLAELSGGHGTTLNHRAPGVPYEIEYPFTGSGRPEPEHLPLSDLTVDLDPHRGLPRLRSARLGTEVRALALGLLTTPALPPAARLLALAFGDKPMAQVGARGTRQSSTTGTRPYPRVVAGRVVLHRGTWVTSSDAVPRRAAGEDDAAYLLRLTEWRRTTGVPARCFVRALPTAGPAPGVRMLDKSRKPVYLDFDNWFLLLAFENMLRGPAELLVFEEALPDPEEATEPADAPRVVELLVEIGEQAGAVLAAAGGAERHAVA